ncbi:MAG: metal-sensing transcriptional repressor [Burkholderiaceae bacterium]|jgi:DNA-binding FrmR family transcriptional regulator|nr:metal-sensing transcriptional repressor [Burkholderiaceae bacterium]
MQVIEEGAATARHELVLRLKRVEGQLRGIQRMIETGDDCEPIAQQLSASRKALDKAFFELLACAIEHPEFTLNRKETKDRRIQRMARALARLA